MGKDELSGCKFDLRVVWGSTEWCGAQRSKEQPLRGCFIRLDRCMLVFHCSSAVNSVAQAQDILQKASFYFGSNYWPHV